LLTTPFRVCTITYRSRSQRIDLGEAAKMMKRRSNSITGSIGLSGATTDPSADAALAKMGYQSELPRNLSMMSVLGL
jgi:hypothetical protein